MLCFVFYQMDADDDSDVSVGKEDHIKTCLVDRDECKEHLSAMSATEFDV